MFEPFHPQKVDAYRHFNYFQYMRPEAENPALRNYCEKIFTGHIRHGWVDRPTLTSSRFWRSLNWSKIFSPTDWIVSGTLAVTKPNIY